MIASVPTLDDLARDPSRAAGLPIETIAGLLAKHSAVGNALGAALLLSKSNSAGNTEPVDEIWLTPDEAAPILKHSRRWIYRRAATLPFVKRVSRKSLLCSRRGIDRWLATRKA